jgi:hypothetical protein
MIDYAADATEATWGVPGPTFLVVYLSAAAILLAAAIVHRRRLFAGPAEARLARVDAQQAAYLNMGAQLAVFSARARRGRLQRGRPADPGPGPGR